MKSLSRKIFILFVVGSFGIGAVSSYLARQSRLTIADSQNVAETVDLGSVVPQTRHLIPLCWRNDTGSTFKFNLKDITTSCGCTSVSVTKTEIPPNDILELQAHLAVNPIPEALASSIEINGTSGQYPKTVRFYIKAVSQEIISIQRPNGYIDLGVHSLVDFPASIDVAIARGSYPLTFDSITAECSGIAVDVTAQSKDAWSARFHLQSTFETGSRGETVVFHFWNKGRLLDNVQFLQALYVVQGPIDTLPRSIVLGALRPNASTNLSILIRPHADHAQQIALLDTQYHGKGALSHLPLGIVGNSLTIPISYTAPKTPGPDEGSIAFVVELDGRKYTVDVPYVELTTE